MSGRPDVPVGLPVVWARGAANQVLEGARARTTAATVSRLAAGAATRTGRRGLGAVRDSLSARDWQVLAGVAANRYLTTRQVEGFWFDGHASALSGARLCRRVLHRLSELRVLVHLERRIGGARAGSASYVWQVGPVGDRLLRDGVARARRRQREPGLLFLDHCLAVADAHLALVRAHRAGELELVEVQTEPDCWRPFTGLGGARLVLQPDLYVVTGDPADRAYVNRWFVEVDRGTEQLPRLHEKCKRYEAARRVGAGQAADEGFPLVVWVMRDQASAERLAGAISRDAQLDNQLYRVTTGEHFVGLICGGAA
jgi:hypothetical protein